MNKINNCDIDFSKLSPQESSMLKCLLAKAQNNIYPEKGSKYYFLNSCLDIIEEIWNSCDVDIIHYNIGNYFLNRNKAEFVANKIKVTQELFMFAEQHNTYIYWDNKTLKYYLAYSPYDQEIKIKERITYKDANIFFSSVGIAKKAIETIGEKRLLKYYFEVI